MKGDSKMKNLTKAMTVILLIAGGTLFAQDSIPQASNPAPQVNLSGPRMGFTIITGEAANTLREKYEVLPVITQFGWQSEIRFYSVENGPTALMEVVALVGGLDQELFFPSFSLLAGVRFPDGREFGVGPNISGTGSGYVIAGGFTRSYGAINFPVNFSVLLAKSGVRLSLMFGFNAITTQ
jgi:hypothetical protein